jgi:hypothetical protein
MLGLEMLEKREVPTVGLTVASASPMPETWLGPVQAAAPSQGGPVRDAIVTGQDGGLSQSIRIPAAWAGSTSPRYEVVDGKVAAPFATSVADAWGKRTETTRTLDTVTHLAGDAEHPQPATAANASSYSVAHAAVTEDYVWWPRGFRNPPDYVRVQHEYGEAERLLQPATAANASSYSVAHAAVTESSGGRGLDGTHIPPPPSANASNYSVADAVFTGEFLRWRPPIWGSFNSPIFVTTM